MKTFERMQAEVREVNEKLGWWDEPVTWKTAMALLHSEVSEALEAWRKNGLEPWFTIQGLNKPVKPEGVPSELADILIRLLDDTERFSISVLEKAWSGPQVLVRMESQDLPDDLEDLHMAISMLSGWSQWSAGINYYAENILFRLRDIADKYKIDLAAEYEKKLDYNRTREYRHGKKC